MALFARINRSTAVYSQLIKAISFQAVRKNHWYPDFKPGPYPKTEKERLEAAKKYNMFPEEYKPIDDDGHGCGDYPDVPSESWDEKDHFYDWDNTILRRNYGEPVNLFEDNLLPEYASTKKPEYTLLQSFCIFFGYVGAFGAFFYWFMKFEIFEPFMEKQMVGGDTHYTFELDYDELERSKIKCECP